MSIKNIIPQIIKLKIRLLKRIIVDEIKGCRSKFAKTENANQPFNHAIKLSQEIKDSHLCRNKIENIKIASNKIGKIIIYPGEIFSFWRIVGEPDRKNGFKIGRNIISGKLHEDYGGGLCQLSGIIYHVSLIAGLKILERYNHTIDLYTDETRFTPLGTDATVVYGYKDLRIMNNYNSPVNFKFEIKDHEIVVELRSVEYIEEKIIRLEKKELENTIEVFTFNQKNEILNKSHYKKKEC
jgi:vancomycin resistance protein VanW